MNAVAPARYRIAVRAAAGDPRVDDLRDAVVGEVAALGAADHLLVDFDSDLGLGQPSLAVVFWSDELNEDDLVRFVTTALDAGLVLIPVVDSTQDMPQGIVTPLSRLNAIGWDDVGAQSLARLLLRELGVHESQRGVFLSHRRQDGLVVADQLHDALMKAGWTPFVDRFGVDIGRNVQNRIDEALEESAFLLLLETPGAQESPWVEHEVLYALDHHMGVAIVNIKGAKPLPVVADLPRYSIPDGEVSSSGTHLKLSDEAVRQVVGRVETNHAAALVRRRRQLLVSVQASATSAGRSCTPVPGWRLKVENNHESELVGILPHLPVVGDLYSIDGARDPGERGVLVHAAHTIPTARTEVLDWSRADRPLDLVPNNAIGARWRGN